MGKLLSKINKQIESLFLGLNGFAKDITYFIWLVKHSSQIIVFMKYVFSFFNITTIAL